MKLLTSVFTSIVLVSIFSTAVFAQGNVAINNTGASPDASAILDVQSTDKGLLVPRMSTVDRNAIPSPAVGLIVYDLDFDRFYCFAGSSWIEVMAGFTSLVVDADGDTGIDVEETPDEDIIRFEIEGTEMAMMDGRTFHLQAPGNSVFIGVNAGSSDDGTSNINTAVGFYALRNSTTGNNNVSLGYNADRNNETGSRNTIIGSKAGQGDALHNKSGNIFLGYQAGYNETGNNKLYIENSDSNAPLIYGDFTDDAEVVGINGFLGVGTQAPAYPLTVSEDGVDSVQTVVGVLRSATSGRPILLFSENTTNTLFTGMSIEYNGAAGTGDHNEMYINQIGGDQLFTFENSGELGIGTTEPLTKLHIEGGTDTGLSGGGYITLGPIDGSNISIDNNEIMARNNGGVANIYMQANGGKLGIGAVSFDSKVNIRSSSGENPLRTRIEGTTKFLVHNNGGVAIGASATPPVNGLKVEGDIKMDGDDITSTQTLRLNSSSRIELVVGDNTIVIDPIDGISITSDDDITFDSANDIYFNAEGSIFLEAYNDITIDASTDLFAVSGFDMKLDATIFEIDAGSIDINSAASIDIDGGAPISIDATQVSLNASHGDIAPATRQGESVSNPACGTPCIGTIISGSATVLIGG